MVLILPSFAALVGVDNSAIHHKLVVAVVLEPGMCGTLLISPGLVKHDFSLFRAVFTQIVEQLGERLGVGVVFARQGAGLLYGDYIPFIIGKRIGDRGFAALYALSVGSDIAVVVGLGIAAQIIDVARDGATADKERPYDGGISLGSSDFMEVLLHGIAREAVAHGEDSQRTGRSSRCNQDQCKK